MFIGLNRMADTVAKNAGSSATLPLPLLKMPSSNTVVIGICIAAFISMFIAAFVQMTNFVGSKDDWNDLKPKIMQVVLLTVFGTVAFAIATILFCIQNPSMSVYFALIVSCIAIGLSFASLAVAGISR